MTVVRVAITGALGLVGRALSNKLKAEGFEVLPFSRSKEATASGYWDVTKPLSRAAAKRLEGADVLIHLAAYIPSDHTDIGQAKHCLDVNSLGTLNVLRACAGAKVRKVVYVSSANVLNVSNEHSVKRGSYDCSYALPYLSSKALGEIYAKDHSFEGVSTLIIRPSSLYDKSSPCPIMSYIKRCLEEGKPVELYGSGEFTADYLLLDDFVDAVLRGIRGCWEGEVNVGTGEAVSTLALAELACKLKGLPPSKFIRFIDSNRLSGASSFGAVEPSVRLAKSGFSPTKVEDGLVSVLGGI